MAKTFNAANINTAYITTETVTNIIATNITITNNLTLQSGASLINDTLTLTLPSTGGGVIPSDDSTSTFTNKTITDATNVVNANILTTNPPRTILLSTLSGVPVSDGVLNLLNAGWVPNSEFPDISPITTSSSSSVTVISINLAANVGATVVMGAIVFMKNNTTLANSGIFIIRGLFSVTTSTFATQLGTTSKISLINSGLTSTVAFTITSATVHITGSNTTGSNSMSWSALYNVLTLP